MHYFRSKILLIHLCLIISSVAYAGIPERNPLPEHLGDKAEIPGIENARNWADEIPPETEEWLTLSDKQLKDNYPSTYGAQHNYLAISGGGQNGAFGAGLLYGWTESGTRPEFTMVTGVSTGALLAPFAFLGPAYDHQIKEVYTSHSTKDIVEQSIVMGSLFGDSVSNSKPLKKRIEKYIDKKVMAAIAEEYRKGRILEIITTNLDAGRPVSWSIGRIAASGSPHALQLIHDIILASTSIPVAFPPVMFDVEAENKLYDELHVDGGATSIVHLYPIGLDWDKVAKRMKVKGRPNVYVIRNGQLIKKWETVKRSTIPIAMRSLNTVMSNLVLGDIYRIYLSTQRDGINYHLAYIPDDFTEKSSEHFDKNYMTKLFNAGYKLAKDGYIWNTTPPGYESYKK